MVMDTTHNVCVLPIKLTGTEGPTVSNARTWYFEVPFCYKKGKLRWWNTTELSKIGCHYWTIHKKPRRRRSKREHKSNVPEFIDDFRASSPTESILARNPLNANRFNA